MKFVVNRKGAPDIPLELLEAQEAGQLVFFCGAGISSQAGLPDFHSLVNKVYESLGEQHKDLEAEAIKSYLFDRALGLLEARICGEDNSGAKNLVRTEIIKALTLENGANLQTHEAILELSRIGERGYRLVTTNVDLGFKNAKSSKDVTIDAGPKLPIPKPHRWSSVVHLHGLIDEDRDPDGLDLIFTSGDFGSAYLTERWASKFVTELFTHFVVCFVGYSVNDPVIRYITDAIAAERRRGFKGFRKPYVIAHTAPSKRRDNTLSWEARGLTPVLYEYRHSNLHNTMKEWASYARDGMNAKQRLILREALVSPLPPYELEPAVNRILPVLRERKNPNHKDVSGAPAKYFSVLENPPAPIAWLPALDQEGLLNIGIEDFNVNPVSGFPVSSNLKQPNKITWALWRWMLHHLEERDLVLWVISKGVCLHPSLREMLKLHISRSPPKEPFGKFWRILTSSSVICQERSPSDDLLFIRSIGTSVDELVINKLRQLIDPQFRIKKSFSYDTDHSEGSPEGSGCPYDLQVEIGLTREGFGRLSQSDIYPSRLLGLLYPATDSLIKALNMWSYAGTADKLRDRSHWDMVSIADHPQNKRFRNWTILIELCRDLWAETWKTNPKLARAILNTWQMQSFPTMRRLVLHAITTSTVATQKQSMDYLLENDGWWLWSLQAHREVLRFFANKWSSLNNTQTDRLVNAILTGPPREMYSEDLSEEQWERREARDIWFLLAKLESFGRGLPEIAKTKLDELSAKFPAWRLEGSERDEFSFWMESRVGYEEDLSEEELFALTVEGLVNKLCEESKQYRSGRLDVFRRGAKDNPEKVTEVLIYLASNQLHHNRIWSSGLVGMADSDDPRWSTLAPLLGGQDSVLFEKESWAIAWWTKKAIEGLSKDSNQFEAFWPIFNKVLENSASEVEEIMENGDPIGYAINHPNGIITGAFIEILSNKQLEAGECIPRGAPLNAANKLTSNSYDYVAGKIVLASRLYYLFTVDPEWTKANLIPLFDWASSEIPAWMWIGYSWSPRISADLAEEICDQLIIAVSKSGLLGDAAERINHLFAVVCLEYPDLYSKTEQLRAFESMGATGLGQVAEFFWRSTSADSDSADAYWTNRIKPLMRSAWPKSAELISDYSSQFLTMIATELDLALEDAWQFVKPLVRPFRDLSWFLHHLIEKPHAREHPELVLDIISTVFSPEYEWPDDSLREILNTIAASNEELVRDLRFRNLDMWLTQAGR